MEHVEKTLMTPELEIVMTKLLELFKYYNIDSRMAAGLCGRLLYDIYRRHSTKQAFQAMTEALVGWWDTEPCALEPLVPESSNG